MNRRRLLVVALALGGIAAAEAIKAQPEKKSHRVGWLGPAENPENLAAFRAGMRELGYVEAKNLIIEARYGEQPTLRDIANRLARTNPDVILTDGSAATRAVQQAKSSIPVVFVSGDPIEMGVVTSLARPGGTMTGMAVFAKELNVKRLELLREALGHAARLGVLHEPRHRESTLAPIEEAAAKLGFAVLPLEVRSAGEMEKVLAGGIDKGANALLPVSSALFHAERQRLVDFAAKHRLPAVYENRAFVEAGGLMSYGPDMSEVFRRSATYVHKIITGTKPADLPVEQPARFELVINQKVAKALGLTIPPALLLQATAIVG